MSILTTEEISGDAFREHMTATAPPCQECGGKLVATRMPERREVYSEPGTDDFVCEALEVYRCEECSRRLMVKVELDRITREERDAERDRAVARAQMRRKEPLLLAVFRPKAWELEVQRQYPRRKDPDLMQRWIDRRLVSS